MIDVDSTAPGDDNGYGNGRVDAVVAGSLFLSLVHGGSVVILLESILQRRGEIITVRRPIDYPLARSSRAAGELEPPGVRILEVVLDCGSEFARSPRENEIVAIALRRKVFGRHTGCELDRIDLAICALTGNHIAPGAQPIQVAPRTSAQRVVPVATIEHVIAITAIEHIVTGVALQQVIAAATR
ncbi:MAG: hypothetical protein ACR2RL_12555 [Gammaproteobacteria bacterium]